MTTAETPAPKGAGHDLSAMIAVLGRPNSGKSTFVNRLVGEKVSIVSNKPQTTRHRILGLLSSDSGQLVFIDTPGIHKPLYRLNRCMMQAASSAVDDADVVVLIVDAAEGFGGGDRYVIEFLKGCVKPLFVLLNKLDLIRPSRLLPLMDTYGRELNPREIIPISALRGENMELVARKLWECAASGEKGGGPLFPEGMRTDRSDLFRASEIVREKILEHTRDELPWATAVRVDQSETEGDLWRLYMTILVEKKSQRPILIGRGGLFLKTVGTEARREIESTFGKKVYLSLQVSHEEHWRDDPRQLAAMEIYEQE